MRTNGDEIVPSTEEGGGMEEEEEEEEGGEEEDGDATGGDGNRSTPNQISIQSTENRRHKRSLRHGLSRLIATKRRKEKKKKDSDAASDSVSSPSQISCCLLPPCLSRPQSLPPDSPLSVSAFQSLIERNDFYSPECNVHRNLGLSTRGHGD